MFGLVLSNLAPRAKKTSLFPMTPTGIEAAIRDFVSEPNYPCIAALRALHRRENEVGIYENFGSGSAGLALRNALGDFLQRQKETGAEYLTYWAIFDGPTEFSEDEFEKNLWFELSSLTSLEQKREDWGSHPDEPGSKNFSFSLFGEPFFVVGLHPGSSRRGRRFARPALIFNVFRQFEELQRKGAYEPMVRTNRARDLKYDGSVNPMAELHGESWESIQFSGKKNSNAWKCPFRFLHRRSGEI